MAAHQQCFDPGHVTAIDKSDADQPVIAEPVLDRHHHNQTFTGPMTNVRN